MTLALVIGGSMILGFALAEAWHRIANRRQRAFRSREALIAEFVDKQYWQFVSLDEWLSTTETREKWLKGERS